MSTEVESNETSLPGEAVASTSTVVEAPPATSSQPMAKPALWQQRRYRLAAGIAFLALVAGVVGNNLIARQYTPEGAVRQYLSALQSDDAATAWSQIQVAAPAEPAAVTLTDQAALKAALAAGKPDLKGFNVTSTSSADSSTSIVSVSYDTSSGTKQAKFIVQRSGQARFAIYPLWHLVITPTLLQITLPKGSAGVSIDGKAISLPDGKSTVAVLPLFHKVAFAGTQMLATQTVAVDAFLSLGQSVTYQPNLTVAGLDRAKAAIKASFAACAKSTSANLDSGACPQGVTFYLPQSGQWQVIGDPTQDLTISFDQDLNVAGIGHFQMVFAYQEHGYQGITQVASGGGYSAPLILSTTDLAVANIQGADGLPALSRPGAATDQAAKDIVAKAFAQCASVQAEWVADCPQRAPQAGITNVRWSLSGDPTAGATVSFDQKTGIFTLHGNFSMGVTYDFFGYPSGNRSSYITAYNASLFWDGQAFQLVTVDGAVS